MERDYCQRIWLCYVSYCMIELDSSSITIWYDMMWYIILHYAILDYTILHYAILDYTILHYAILDYTTLCYTRLYYTMIFLCNKTSKPRF